MWRNHFGSIGVGSAVWQALMFWIGAPLLWCLFWFLIPLIVMTSLGRDLND